MEALVYGLLAGLAFLETWPVGQLLLTRPALLLPAVGWLIGLPEFGLWLGLTLELLNLRALPMGSALPPDPAMGGLLALLACKLCGPMPESDILLPLVLFVGAILPWPAAYLSELQRRVNGRVWLPRFEDAVRRDDRRRLGWLLPLALLQAWLLIGLLCALAIAGLGRLLLFLEPRLIGLESAGAGRIGWWLLAIAAGGILQLAAGRGGTRALWSGLAAGLLLVAALLAGGAL